MTRHDLDSFLEAAENSGDMDVEGAKLDFAIGLAQLLRENAISKKELARRLKVSQPMISKILRGDTNVTIETMARAAHAASGKLRISVSPATRAHDVHVEWGGKLAFERSSYRRAAPSVRQDSATLYDFKSLNIAANDNEIQSLAA